MPARVDELVLRVEAILFASGKPLSIHELTEMLGVGDHRPVQRAIKKLAHAYAGRQTALEVRRVGDGFALQLRQPFLETARPVSPTDIAPRSLKVLTLIAYHQPMLQSLLARMVGEVAYEEVQRLRDLGLIRGEPKGATLSLTTTRSFSEYFGIGSTRPEEIRAFLEKKLGVTPSGAPNVPSVSEVAPPPAGPAAEPAPSPEAPTP
jgi:segregation and condensation protein B